MYKASKYANLLKIVGFYYLVRILKFHKVILKKLLLIFSLKYNIQVQIKTLPWEFLGEKLTFLLIFNNFHNAYNRHVYIELYKKFLC